MKKFLYSVFMLAAVVLAACSNDDNGDIQPKTIIEEAPFRDYDWYNAFGQNLIYVKKYIDDIHGLIA